MGSNEESGGLAIRPERADRYSRQILLEGIGHEGQERLAKGRVAVCGCGALGSVSANILARAGVGFLRIIDRDYLEWHNLQRQVLFEEEDVLEGLPKAEAAARRLRKINSEIQVEPVVTDLDHTNVLELIQDVDVIVDGTDNFETRYLLNDAAVKLGKPWIYGGCIGSHGQTMTIVPHETPCLRCVIEAAPPPGMAPTCETAGILAPAVHVVAALQATEALKLLVGRREALNRDLLFIDVWEGVFRRFKIAGLQEVTDCPACRRGEFPWLEGKLGSHTVSLCGRNAVQIVHRRGGRLSFEELARKLQGVGNVRYNQFLLRFEVDGHEITVFPDGRAIIKGTSDVGKARSLYAQYIGT
jgi:molybdopterin/thiamine biosynthesis adenylyltransferase